MITIGIIASWFLISSAVYAIIDMTYESLANKDRGFSTFLVLFSQGAGAFTTWAVDRAIH